MSARKISILIPLATLVLAACSLNSGEGSAQLATATLAPIVSLTPRATATPVPSRTPLPTFTATPSDTPISPTPSNTPTASATPPITGIIASVQRVNIRSGPGVSFSALEALPPGTGVDILGQNSEGTWYNIKMEDGREGWVAAGLVRVRDTPTPVPTATPSPDHTAIFLGTPLPTAILGGGTVTPTPPRSITTATAVTDVPVVNDDGTLTANELLFIPVIEPTSTAPTAVIDISSINQTATALATAVSTLFPTPSGGPTSTVVIATGVGGQQGNTTSQQGVDVLAYCNDRSFGSPPPTTLRAGATIDVFWSWFATTRQLVLEHIDNAIYEVRVDGEVLANWRQFSTPIERRADGNFWISWFVPFGPLSAGQHEIAYRVTWEQRISDGFNSFGPGTNTPFETGRCTFTVR